jgi:hypothetical protein
MITISKQKSSDIRSYLNELNESFNSSKNKELLSKSIAFWKAKYNFKLIEENRYK